MRARVRVRIYFRNPQIDYVGSNMKMKVIFWFEVVKTGIWVKVLSVYLNVILNDLDLVIFGQYSEISVIVCCLYSNGSK